MKLPPVPNTNGFYLIQLYMVLPKKSINIFFGPGPLLFPLSPDGDASRGAAPSGLAPVEAPSRGKENGCIQTLYNRVQQSLAVLFLLKEGKKESA